MRRPRGDFSAGRVGAPPTKAFGSARRLNKPVRIALPASGHGNGLPDR
jgi:hypothetical protein